MDVRRSHPHLIGALFVALAGVSRIVSLRRVVKAYIEVIRGTPLLQLIYIYYVLPEIGIGLPAFIAGSIAFTLNYAACISEVYHGGIQAIPVGQHDAAAALGMTPGLSMRRIILPQAIRIIIPSLANYFISLFKETALCSVVSIQEVVFTAQNIAAQNFRYFTLYPMVAAMHFTVSFPIARLVGTSSASPAAATGADTHDRPSTPANDRGRKPAPYFRSCGDKLTPSLPQ